VTLEVSVVIPTHDRIEILPAVVVAVEAQVKAPSFEVLVVDDGSSDGTADWLRAHRSPVPFRVLTRDGGGPAGARNAGVRAAQGRFVALLGDDTVPVPGWLAALRRAHAERDDGPEIGVVGYTGWHPRMRLNPFLRYVNEHGKQFGYALIEDREHVPFNFLYTSNLSLSRQMLLDVPFDERFPYPAWEDIEAGYRMTTRHRMRLVYVPEARTAHYHPTSFTRFAEREEKVGYSAVLFYRLHPELGPFLGLAPAGPPPLPSATLQTCRETVVRALEPLPVSLPGLWSEALRYHYIRGLHRGWSDDRGGVTPGPSPGARPRSHASPTSATPGG
jgi:glycosyltransferase involved in cell wall biosynthesis